MKKLKIKKIRQNAKIPERQTEGSVGYDISACLDGEVEIPPGETRMVGSGLSIALERGYAAFIYARSGMAVKHGVYPANCVGVIDSDYRGEIIVGLRNASKEAFTVKDGDRIAQMVITECTLPELIVSETLDETERGAGGFGSTGKS